MSLFKRFISAYMATGWRGSYRVMMTLANTFRSLQSYPIEVQDGTIFVDLRIGSSHGILANTVTNTGEKEIIRQVVREGDVVYDIGAHLGVYTLVLSGCVGKTGAVHAFEPNPELLPSLERTLSNLANVELHRLALANTEGVVELYVPEDASMASLSNWTKGAGGNVHTVTCEKRTLDNFIAANGVPAPSFIKCDVEGAELEVFQGGKEMLDKESAPIILFEINTSAARAFQANHSECCKFLESLDAAKYSFFEVTVKGLTPLVLDEVVYCNVLAVPAAKRQRLSCMIQ